MPLHSYQIPRQSPFKSKEPTYPQASVWCRGLCMWLSRVDESFPALPGSFAADKFVFLKVSINSAWGPFFESNGRNTPPTKLYLQGHTYFSFTSVKNTADVPIRCLKDLLLLAARIDHKRIWRPLVIQDRKLQVKNLLRSRVAQEKRKRQKVTASVQTH